MTRPLWTATLVHGLAGGRQAVAVALHHALADGMAAITTFTEFTSSAAEEVPAGLRDAAAADDRQMPQAGLIRKAIADSGQLLTGFAPLVRSTWSSRRLATQFRTTHDMPRRGLLAHRNSLSRTFGTERVCATSSHPLADLKSISKATGGSINGVLHAVIAEALRREIASRGEDLAKPLRAGFGIAADPPGTRRLWGNNVSITSISLHTDIDDPVERLHKVSVSARKGVELRRLLGLGIQPAAMSYASRLAPQVVRHAGKVGNIAHVMTANVPGPRTRRWAGDVEVADFYSLAVLVPPIGLNMTAYSYAGKLNIGLLTAPEVHSEPARLLERIDESMVAICEALGLTAADRDNPTGWG